MGNCQLPEPPNNSNIYSLTQLAVKAGQQMKKLRRNWSLTKNDITKSLSRINLMKSNTNLSQEAPKSDPEAKKDKQKVAKPNTVGNSSKMDSQSNISPQNSSYTNVIVSKNNFTYLPTSPGAQSPLSKSKSPVPSPGSKSESPVYSPTQPSRSQKGPKSESPTQKSESPTQKSESPTQKSESPFLYEVEEKEKRNSLGRKKNWLNFRRSASMVEQSNLQNGNGLSKAQSKFYLTEVIDVDSNEVVEPEM